jgi:hypothetical protein
MGAGAVYRHVERRARHRRAALLHAVLRRRAGVIYNTELSPASWDDLAGKRRRAASAGIASAIEKIRVIIPKSNGTPSSCRRSNRCQPGIRRHDRYAIVAANEAEIARSAYLNVERAFSVAAKLELVGVSHRSGAARQGRRVFRAAQEGWHAARMIERYFARKCHASTPACFAIA